MFKVLKEVIQDNSKGERGESEVPCLANSFSFSSQVRLSGRVRDNGAKQLLAKQPGNLGDNLGAQMDLGTGQIKTKKLKKEKKPQELAMEDLKKLGKKPFGRKYA